MKAKLIEDEEKELERQIEELGILRKDILELKEKVRKLEAWISASNEMDVFAVFVLIGVLTFLGLAILEQQNVAIEECVAQYGAENCTCCAPIIDLGWFHD